MSGSENATTAHTDADGPLARAEARLAQAIGRLEAALDNRPDAGATAEAAELEAQVARLKAENDDLRELVGEAAGRLDGAIARLKRRAGG